MAYLKCLLIVFSVSTSLRAMDTDYNAKNEFQILETSMHELQKGVQFISAAPSAVKFRILHDCGLSDGYAGSTHVLAQSGFLVDDENNSSTSCFQECGKKVDNREIVSDTTIYPYRCFAHLKIQKGGKNFVGSGVLVGPWHVMSAAHCLIDYSSGKMAESITVICGCSNGYAPYGTQKVVRAYLLKNYLANYSYQTRTGENIDFDVMLLILDVPIGYRIGWLGCAFMKQNDMFARKEINVTGYPGDKQASGAQMWSKEGKIKYADKEHIYFEIFIFGGQSGGPIWLKLDSQEGVTPHVVGIITHADIHDKDDYVCGNFGIRLTEAKFMTFMKLIAQTSKAEIAPGTMFISDAISSDCCRIADEYYFGSTEDKVLDGLPLKDFEKARSFYEKAVEQSDDQQSISWALRQLGEIYFKGKGVSRNFKRAFLYYEQLAGSPQEIQDQFREFTSASHGIGTLKDRNWALMRFADCLYSGHAVKEDKNQAREFYLKVAHQHEDQLAKIRSCLKLGDLYFELLLSKEIDPKELKLAEEKAIFYYKMCSEQEIYKNLRAKSWLKLARFFSAANVKENLLQASYYYQEAAQQQNNLKVRSLAAFKMGERCYRGSTGQKSFDQAASYFKIVVEHSPLSLERFQACGALGEIYYTGGYGLKQSYQQAFLYYNLLIKEFEQMPPTQRPLFKWFSTLFFAEEKDEIMEKDLLKKYVNLAYLRIAEMYRAGSGIERNQEKAFQLYTTILQ